MLNKFNSKYIIQEKKTTILKKSLIAVLILVLMAVCFGSGMYITGKSEMMKNLADKELVLLGKVIGKYSQSPESKLSQDVDFNLFWEVWDILEKEFVDRDKLSEKEMFYGAVRGMVSSLGDPYTVFMNPIIAREFAEDLAGTFEGIGAEIGIRDEILTIIAPLSDMPAEKAGLRAGDKVYAIDGESTMNISIDEAVNKIRGPKGTEVVLTISRNGMEKAKDVAITRGVIIVKSVKTEILNNNINADGNTISNNNDNVYIIKITNFNDDTLNLFNEAVREIIAKNPSGIILDLRNNPGGYLETAIEVSSEWIEEAVVVAEQFSEEKKLEYLSRGRARLKDYPTIVLVNQGSASASEIVAGALQDYGKAKIVGMQTFGKGSVQALQKLKDGSSVKITVAKWLTPKGNCINEEGITPDEEIDLTIEDYEAGNDPQMDRAVEILKK
ncbi:S41 family peptidase [Patescibacteria group bacterium]|nr:S41 family peptidase [Patescibacteria group bacterium]MBU4601338.1 S41 family peptidase [Patescibacteria group bacterium]MCG2698022.1 S41 family peptidase [Candidatus Parcubacteria bacterium]